ncbi:MAG: GSU2403 family nucleotidyltransferase fold protein [Campylobacterota bacterium]|nr:GSU2403 family nucleotidyltransferase fold protein [Campylobacterota bacterium]
MFEYYDYSDAQIKQRHNSKMLYESYLNAVRAYNTHFRFKMVWQKHQDGTQRLAKQHLKSGKREYLGKRSAQTKQMAFEFSRSKNEAMERIKNLKTKIKKDEKLNKLEGIARAPKELISIFRKINELGLDDKLIAIGTNALYAYEARCGVMLEQEQLATRDIDLLNRKDKGVSFLFSEFIVGGRAEELITSIDSSFQKSEEVPYRFVNKDGVWLELINPTSDTVRHKSLKDNVFFDLIPLAMSGIQWLENSRLFKECLIGENGKCAIITTVHPLEYAVYKNWLGKREDRDYLKHTRDLEQSKLVTELIHNYMPDINIERDLTKLKHFKKEVVDSYFTNVFSAIKQTYEEADEHYLEENEDGQLTL